MNENLQSMNIIIIQYWRDRVEKIIIIQNWRDRVDINAFARVSPHKYRLTPTVGVVVCNTCKLINQTIFLHSSMMLNLLNMYVQHVRPAMAGTIAQSLDKTYAWVPLGLLLVVSAGIPIYTYNGQMLLTLPMLRLLST